jgi:hypothetical protein
VGQTGVVCAGWNDGQEASRAGVLSRSVTAHTLRDTQQTACLLFGVCISVIMVRHRVPKRLRAKYKLESNENFKIAIKIRNTARLSCKLAAMILMVWRMADRWQYDAGMQRDGAVVG